MIDINLFGTDKNDNIVNEPLEMFFQEVLMAFSNNELDVCCLRDSMKLKRYVFSKFANAETIKADVLKYIGDHCYTSSSFRHDVEVQIMKSKGNKDLVYITLNVYVPKDTETTSTVKYTQQFLIGQ